MRLRGSRCLVTGGGGFIGSHIAGALLDAGVGSVLVYDNFVLGRRENLDAYRDDPRLAIYPYGGDVRDTDQLDAAMAGIDFVFHLAAMWLMHCRDFPRTAHHVNVDGSFNVLEACVRHRVKRLVFSSSGSVYGDAVELPMKESHPHNNRTFYGATKIAGEAMCRAYHERYGLSVVGLRYMNVYGPRQNQLAADSGVIPTLLNCIEGGQAPVIHGDGTQAFDFVYVDDVARANLLAAERGEDDSFYNVGTGEATSILDLTRLLLDSTKSSLIPEHRPYGEHDQRRLVRHRVGDVSKAERELGFRAAIPLREGLSRLVSWRRAGRRSA